MNAQPDEFDKLLESCRQLRDLAALHESQMQNHEKRIARMEKIQMALLKAAGAFLKSLEEQDSGGDSMSNGKGD